MKEMNLKLAVFEGPLDLLLHLIQQYELDIYDIPISEITEQYMSYIHAMKDLQLEVAGEYLVMAATLMSIKSQMLLPTMEEEEEFFDDFFEEDPRDLLVAQLVEYKKYKAAAHQLSDYADQRQLFFSKEPLDMDEYKEVNQELPDNQVNTIDLFLAFHQLLEKRKKRAKFEASISNDKVTIEECIKTIETRVHLLTDKQGCPFDSLFDTGSKEEIVTTFMALLELLKYKKEWNEIYENLQKYGIRNSQISAIAPNTSSSLIQGCTASVLPIYSKFFVETHGKGSIPNCPPFIKDKFWFYQENRNIDQRKIIEIMARINKWIDTGISIELMYNLNRDIRARDIYETIMKAWKNEIKTLYYTRTIQKDGSSAAKEECVSCAG